MHFLIFLGWCLTFAKLHLRVSPCVSRESKDHCKYEGCSYDELTFIPSEIDSQ